MTPIEPPLDEGEGRDLAIVKAVVGLVPVVGGALVELVGLQDPLAKRREGFYVAVCDAINERSIVITEFGQRFLRFVSSDDPGA